MRNITVENWQTSRCSGQQFGRLVLVLLLCTFSQPALAKDYKASLAQMPVYAESLEKGVLVDLVKLLADFAPDPHVKSLDLKTLKRQLFQVFDVKIVLPKGDNGKEVDLFLSDTIKKLRDSGKFAALMNAIDQPYNDWQP